MFPLAVAGITALIGLVLALKEWFGPDISIHDSPLIDAFVPPVEHENGDTIDD